MNIPSKLTEYNHVEESARLLLGRPGWTHVSREMLVSEHEDERSILWMSVGG